MVLVQRVRECLNDAAGIRFSDQDRITNALKYEARSVASLPLRREYLASLCTRSSETVAIQEDGSVALPQNSLRIVGGEVGCWEFRAVDGPDTPPGGMDTDSAATPGSPRLCIRDGKGYVNPPGYDRDRHKVWFLYITDPPNIDALPPLVEDAVVFMAASALARESEEYSMHSALKSAASEKLALLLAPPKQPEGKPRGESK